MRMRHAFKPLSYMRRTLLELRHIFVVPFKEPRHMFPKFFDERLANACGRTYVFPSQAYEGQKSWTAYSGVPKYRSSSPRLEVLFDERLENA